MNEFFYWMGIIYSAIFLLMGIVIFLGFIAEYCFSKMKTSYTLVDIMKIYSIHKRGKD